MDKKILLFVVSAIFLTIFMFGVSAATGIFTNTTINGTNLTGTHLIYVNISECADNCYIGNVTFNWTYYNGTSFRIATVSNNTANQSVFSYSWDTTAFPDSQNGTLNFTAIRYPTNLSTINATNSTANINLDNNAPTIAVYGTYPTAYANTTIRTSTAVANNISLNIYITDAAIGMANTTSGRVCFVNVGTGINHTVPMFNSGRSNGWCNLSDTNASTALNISGLADGNSTIKIYVNDSIAANGNRLNTTLVAHIDTTAPTATATCSPTTVNAGDTFPCTCTGTDATSGVSTSTGTSTSGSVTSTSNTGSFTYTCSVTDNGGLITTATKAYSISQTPSTGGSSTPSTTTPSQRVYSWTKITPGAATIMKDFNAGTGIKQIEITVDNEAQNVKITVVKYDGKPAAVSVEKTGKVYQYLQINAQNLADNLNNAKVQFKIEKSWASQNSLNKDEIVVSKFDETNKVWNELETPYSTEDDTFYYYDVELTSFSYFAISEKAVVDETGTASNETGGDSLPAGEGSNLTWLWVLIGVIVVIAILWAVSRKKK